MSKAIGVSWFGLVLLRIVSAPFRAVFWIFDLVDSKGEPSLLKIACATTLAVMCRRLWLAAVPIELYAFLTVLVCLLGIASRKSLENFANKIAVSLTGASNVNAALTGDLAQILHGLPNLRKDDERGAHTEREPVA